MRTKKYFTIASMFIISCCYYPAQAQSLNGKVIYVSQSQEVMIKFRSVISTANFAIKEEAAQFQTRITNNKNFSINSTVANFKPCNLIIIEGDNTHLFILEYKPSLDLKTEIFYDLSTKARLKTEVDKLDMVAVKDVHTEVSPVPASPAVMTSNTAAETTLTPKQIDDRFSDLKIRANSAYLENRYDNAMELYKEALSLKPNDVYCSNQINAIVNKRKSLLAIDERKAAELTYQKFRLAGDSAFNKKSYDRARAEYNSALEQKPNDSYVLLQLKKMEQLVLDESYKSYMSVGRDALANQFFDNAQVAFNEALKIRPNDPDARKETARLAAAKATAAKKKGEEMINLERQKQFNDTLSVANARFDAGLLEEAKRKYARADLIKPGDPYVLKRISEIDGMLLKRKSEMNKLKGDSLNRVAYNAEIDKGTRALAKKDFAGAKLAFQKAKQLDPQQKFPDEKISEIDVTIAQSQEDKKAEAIQKTLEESKTKKYNLLVRQGKEAVAASKYLLAKGLFTQAKDVKPGEDYPLTQLAMLNGKIEEIENNQKYESYVHLGDSLAFAARNYKGSLKWFDSASLLKPAEIFPKKRIASINQIIAKMDSLTREKDYEKIRTANFNTAVDYFRKAEDDKMQKRYPEAYVGYSEFLKRIDPASLDKYSSNQLYTINQAKDYINRLQRYKDYDDSVRSVRIADSIKNLKSERGRKKKKSNITSYMNPNQNDATTGLSRYMPDRLSIKEYYGHYSQVKSMLLEVV